MPDQPRNPKATTALVLALCGLVSFGLTAVIAVPFAHLGLRASHDTGTGRTKAIWALVLGYLGAAFFAMFVLIAVIGAAVDEALDTDAATSPTAVHGTSDISTTIPRIAASQTTLPPATTRVRATQPPRQPITVSGAGNAVEFVTLSEGRYSVESSVTGNLEFGQATNFITSMYDVNGALCGFGTNEIATSAKGAEVIHIGDGLMDCAPGEIAVEVMAAGDWRIVFTPR